MFKNKDSQTARQKTCANTHGQGLHVGSVQRFVKINPVLVSISEETPARDSSISSGSGRGECHGSFLLVGIDIVWVGGVSVDSLMVVSSICFVLTWSLRTSLYLEHFHDNS